MRGEHSQVERGMRVPRRARLAEVKSAGFLPPLLVAVLFVALGGENSAVRRPCSAMRKRAVVWETPVRCTATAVALRACCTSA
eukprot:2277117-Pleurochrysis_carterae.AAC.1